MSTGKLTVGTANPTFAVILPSKAIGAFDPTAAEGSIAWEQTGKALYVYAPTSDGGLVWQKLQRQ